MVRNASGTFVTLRENKHPPFLFINSTPFVLRVRPKAAHFSRSEPLLVPPHSELPFYEERKPVPQDEDEVIPDETTRELQFQVAVDLEDEDHKGKEKDEEVVDLDEPDKGKHGAHILIGSQRDRSRGDEAAQKRKQRQFDRFFSRYRRPWSLPFSPSSMGEQTVRFHVPPGLVPQVAAPQLDFGRAEKEKEDGAHAAANTLHCIVDQHALTRRLTFSLPSEKEATAAASVRCTFLFFLMTTVCGWLSSFDFLPSPQDRARSAFRQQ